MNIHHQRILALAALALLLSACGNLLTSEQPPRQVYLLQPLSVAAASQSASRQLRFELEVVPGLDNDRVLGLRPDARLIPYANARWPDHLPEVLHSVLRRSLEATGRYARVAPAGASAPGDWRLELEVRAFYGKVDAAGATSSVRAELAGRISCGDEVGRFDLADSAAVAEDRLAAVVAAHQAALDDVTRALIERLEITCADS